MDSPISFPISIALLVHSTLTIILQARAVGSAYGWGSAMGVTPSEDITFEFTTV